MSGSGVLEVEGLSAGYDRRAVLHDVALTVEPGEVVALLGANGAGKTTTLLAVSGLVDVLAGSVSFDGERIDRWAPHRRARAGLAHVPEDRSLFPSMSVREHLRLGGRRSGARPEEVYRWFPALEPLAGRAVGLLSGGEQQMLAVGRALMTRPRLLMVDELSLGLAPMVVSALLDSLRRIAADTGCGVLLVEQHVAMALRTADRGVVLERGRVVADAEADRLAGDPDLLRRSYLGG